MIYKLIKTGLKINDSNEIIKLLEYEILDTKEKYEKEYKTNIINKIPMNENLKKLKILIIKTMF